MISLRGFCTSMGIILSHGLKSRRTMCPPQASKTCLCASVGSRVERWRGGVCPRFSKRLPESEAGETALVD